MPSQALDKFMSDYAATISEFDARLEAAAVAAFGSVDPATYKDGFEPPAVPVLVECWHCEGRYMSNEMRLLYRPRMQHSVVGALGNGFRKLEPLWWCKNLMCDGGGFGHDIHKVRQPRKKATASKAANA